jgi:Rrf2 family protein
MIVRLSKKLMFAIEAVLDIAYNAGMQPVQSGRINERQAIPRRYLEPVLQQLVRAKVLEGVRGPKGGYRLARSRSEISVADIARAVRSTDSGADPVDNPAGSPLGQKVVRPLCQELSNNWMKQLETISIEDLCERAKVTGLASEKTSEKAETPPASPSSSAENFRIEKLAS